MARDNVTSLPVTSTAYGNTTNGGIAYLLSESINLPSAFVMEYTIYRTGANNTWHYALIGDATSRYDVGQLRAKGSLSIRKMPSDTMVADNNNSIIGTNTSVVMTYTYDNGSQSLTANNTTISGSDSAVATKFIGIYKTQDVTITNIKIKAL